MSDLIERQAAIDAINNIMPTKEGFYEPSEVLWELMKLPSAQPEWNNHTVACLLAELFDDPCACNYNGIDEWLPEKCEVIDACPNPVGVACWEQYLKHRAERRTNEILKILESAKDKNGDVPMRLVRQAFEKLPEPCEDAVSRAYKRGRMEVLQECDDIVSRKAVLNLLYDILDRVDQVAPVDHGIYIVARNSVDALPSATPKRKTGKWIHSDFSHEFLHCSECGRGRHFCSNFCPNCGADMRSEAEQVTKKV